MKINLAKSAGFCFGVKRALDIAMETTAHHTPVYMLSDIVHNEEVVKRIKKIGIKKIAGLTHGKDKTLILAAHGTPLKTLQRAKLFGYRIVDATCPMVKEIHRIAQQMEKKGFRIIVIGDKNHDEVRGIVGHLEKKAIVIDDIKHLPLKTIKKFRKTCIVVQSTQNLDKVGKIVETLKAHCQDTEFFNTICQPTRIKQEEIKTMPKVNDVMVIIGSRSSANTRRLYEISKSLNPRSYWINSSREIHPGWFRGAKKIGVAAGASTPAWTIKEIIEYLKGLKG